VLSLLLMMPLSVVNAEGSVTLGASLKVVGVYEPTSTKASDGRTSTQLLQGMSANFVKLAFFKWGETPQSQYSDLQASIKELKQTMPNLIYEGGASAGLLVQGDTWADGSAISDSDFNAMLARDGSGNPIPFWNGYLGDTGSETYRKYLIGWCEKQIDAGVDALHFGEVYQYAQYRIANMRQDSTSTTAEYAQYFTLIANELKTYATSKGRQLLVTLNGGIGAKLEGRPLAEMQVALGMLDYVSVSFSLEDFDPPFTPHEDWASIRAYVTQVMGRDVPIMVWIDWAGRESNTQLSKLAAQSAADQVTVLRNLDASTKAAGVFFAYPVYGGDTVYGKYDSVKYGTYNTIVALAKGTPGTTTTATLPGTTTTATLPGTTTTPHPQRVIQGFPVVSILVGLVTGLALLLIIRRNRRRGRAQTSELYSGG